MLPEPPNSNAVANDMAKIIGAMGRGLILVVSNAINNPQQQVNNKLQMIDC